MKKTTLNTILVVVIALLIAVIGLDISYYFLAENGIDRKLLLVIVCGLSIIRFRFK